mmetsp:Transcript_4367/g.11412  ORF Transcript_4367/g.11412 Transcript_4367/m.11412 type:complete len:273 (+) Transcript_4367:168-986(+)
MLVAITVMLSTLAESGRLAMYTTALATSSTAIIGSTTFCPCGCMIPMRIGPVISVEALPMSICEHAMLNGRPSRAHCFVRPVIACLVAVYGAALGRGTCAEMLPLLMMRPPIGACALNWRKASCVHRNAPPRFVSTTERHCSYVSSSIGTPGVKLPALLKSKSSLPNSSTVALKSALTAAGSVTSVGTTSALPPAAVTSAAVCSRPSRRRPASATAQPCAANAALTARPMPVPAPVTIAILDTSDISSACLTAGAARRGYWRLTRATSPVRA